MFTLTGVHLTPADHNPESDALATLFENAAGALREAQFVASCSEGAYYFDWHAQIDNPVSVLKGAIAHLQRGYDWNETAVNALRDALSIVVDEWYK